MDGGGKDREGMREILFRGKRKDNGEWVEGHLIQSPYMGEVRSWISTPEDKTRLRAIATYYGDWRAVEVGTDTICQYTGLTDKNGNKIWENDIIQYIDGDLIANGIVKFGRHEQIVMLELGFYIEWLGKETECFKTDIYYWIEKRDIEVTGNLFNNACIDELLKGEEG